MAKLLGTVVEEETFAVSLAIDKGVKGSSMLVVSWIPEPGKGDPDPKQKTGTAGQTLTIEREAPDAADHRCVKIVCTLPKSGSGTLTITGIDEDVEEDVTGTKEFRLDIEEAE